MVLSGLCVPRMFYAKYGVSFGTVKSKESRKTKMNLEVKEKLKSFLSPIKILAALVFVALAVLAVLYKPEPFSVLPLFISVIIMFLQTRVNRFAYLVGATNSVLYAVAFYLMSLYSQAAYALLVSCPVQIVTFFLWQRHTEQGATQTRKMTARSRCILASVALVAWVAFYFIFKGLGSAYLLLDNTVSIIGIIATLLVALRFSECAILSLTSGVISLVLYAQMLANDPSTVIWLVFTAYSVVCNCITFINMSRQAKSDILKE